MLSNVSQLASKHYENFPVVSFFLPKSLREAIALIYAFARTADDIADEGALSPEARLLQLKTFKIHIATLEAGESVSDPFFTALGKMIVQHQLSYELFFRLLTAFEQDVTVRRYPTFSAVLRYCHYSAAPIGALLLQLNQEATAVNLRLSHALCTALQLINFLQDLQSDYLIRHRIYLPQRDLEYYHLPETALALGEPKAVLEQVLSIQYQRIAHLLQKSLPLAKTLSGGLKWQVKITLAGAIEMLKRLEQRTQPLSRPTFAWYDWPLLMLKTCHLPSIRKVVP